MSININLVTDQVCVIVKVLERNKNKLCNCEYDANKLFKEQFFVALNILKGLDKVAKIELDKIIESQNKDTIN